MDRALPSAGSKPSSRSCPHLLSVFILVPLKPPSGLCPSFWLGLLVCNALVLWPEFWLLFFFFNPLSFISSYEHTSLCLKTSSAPHVPKMLCKDTAHPPVSFLSSGALLIDHLCKPIIFKSTLFNQVKRKCLPCSVRRVHVSGGRGSMLLSHQLRPLFDCSEQMSLHSGFGGGVLLFSYCEWRVTVGREKPLVILMHSFSVDLSLSSHKPNWSHIQHLCSQRWEAARQEELPRTYCGSVPPWVLHPTLCQPCYRWPLLWVSRVENIAFVQYIAISNKICAVLAELLIKFSFCSFVCLCDMMYIYNVYLSI